MKRASRKDRDSVFVWSSGDIRRVPARAMRAAREDAPAPDVPAAADARRYPRLDLAMPILYRVLGEGASPVPAAVRPYLLAQTKDVSPLGLCISLEEPLRTGVILSLAMHVVERKEKFEAMGRVVWTRPAPDGVHHLVGLQFVVVHNRRVREERHARMESFIRDIQ